MWHSKYNPWGETMNHATVQTLSRDGRSPIRSGTGLPGAFVDPVNEIWIPTGCSVISLASSGHRGDWVELGSYLTKVLSLSQSVSLFFEGVITAELQGWLASVNQLAAVNEITVPNPVATDRVAVYGSLFAQLQPGTAAAVEQLWSGATRFTFSGCDLMLAFHSDGADQFDSLANALGVANAWIVPLDEHLGFLMGLRPDRAFPWSELKAD